MAVYATYTLIGLREALERARTSSSSPKSTVKSAGLLMIIVPEWTDAAEITDLAVDIAFRRLGAGRALVEAAVEWAREREYRALWVEPRADNHAAISFYISLGFRVSGLQRPHVLKHRPRRRPPDRLHAPRARLSARSFSIRRSSLALSGLDVLRQASDGDGQRPSSHLFLVQRPHSLVRRPRRAR